MSLVPLIDARDGQVYPIVQIGDQIWMARNLNYVMAGSFPYNDDPANADIFGRMYTWDAAQASAPAGCHVATAAEWNALIAFVGGSNRGNRLKASSGWNSNNGTDEFGFAALPGGGYGAGWGSYGGKGEYALWWTATSVGSANAAYTVIRPDSTVGVTVTATGADTAKTRRFYVRCIVDDFTRRVNPILIGGKARRVYIGGVRFRVFIAGVEYGGDLEAPPPLLDDRWGFPRPLDSWRPAEWSFPAFCKVMPDDEYLAYNPGFYERALKDFPAEWSFSDNAAVARRPFDLQEAAAARPLNAFEREWSFPDNAAVARRPFDLQENKAGKTLAQFAAEWSFPDTITL